MTLDRKHCDLHVTNQWISGVAKKRDVTFHHDDVSKSRARVLGEWKTLSQETLILEHVFSTLLSIHFL